MIGSERKYLLFLALHVPLALMLDRVPLLATAHALGVLAIGWGLALHRPESLGPVYAVAYIVGAEVLWRMTGARVFWEYGKYATASILLLAMLRAWRLRPPGMLWIYFLLLLPGALVPFAVYPLGQARRMVSFNLSGPFALMVCAWYFSQWKLTRVQLHRALAVALGPILSIWTVAFSATITADAIRFTTASHFVTSGGFGPNQVSSALGLGVVLALFLFLDAALSRRMRLVLALLATAFLGQAMLTFSRNGVYLAGLGGAILVFYLVRTPGTRLRVMALAVVAGVLLVGVVFPWLEHFTQGVIWARLQELDSTGRTEIAQADLLAGWENPLWGVGAGMARAYHARLLRPAAAHTELTRLVGEHGVFGLFALLILLLFPVYAWLRVGETRDKAWILAFLAWALAYMLANAMRLVAPSFLYGLAAGQVYALAALDAVPTLRYRMNVTS